MSELKPCPFCGGKVEWHTAISYRGTEFYIACRSCCCTNFESSIEKAVSKWNTRVYPPEVQRSVERDAPRKPTNLRRGIFGHLHGICPQCGKQVHEGLDKDYDLCPWCQQRLDWGE